MLKKLLLISFVICLLLTGCGKSQNDNMNDKVIEAPTQSEDNLQDFEEIQELYDNLKVEHEALKEKYSKIEKELQDANKEIETMKTNMKKDIRVLDYSDAELRYVFETDQYNASDIKTIVGDNASNLDAMEDVEVLDYRSGSGEVVKLKVLGSIYDFKIVKVDWDEETQDLKEAEALCELKEVRNKDIIFNSYLPEGIPTEKVKWKDAEGNEHSYYVSYDGYGFAGTIILGND